MPSGEWLRDLVFYLIATLIILGYGLVGKITFTMSILFMSLYLVYFVIVIVVRGVVYFSNREGVEGI
jgi:Ca2+/Na+ antiporter